MPQIMKLELPSHYAHRKSVYDAPFSTIMILSNTRSPYKNNWFRAFCLGLSLTSLVGCQSTSGTAVVAEEDINQAPEIKAAAPVAVTDKIEAIIISQSEIEISYEDLWERIKAGFQLNDFYNQEEVITQLNSYTDNQRYFDTVTARASPFLHWIVEEIDRRGLPQELALLPIVESTFNPNAYSTKHAVGLWQFLGSTGQSFGLQQDWWYDGRRDPRASTIAALDYLEQLYSQFDEDWLIALAAYNTGEGNVRKAIRRWNKNNAISEINDENSKAEFWDLPLARETRAHVPKILALAVIISNDKKFGIALSPIPNQEPLAVVEIGAQIDIAQAANLANMDHELLRSLNPGYQQWATHPDSPQHLVVPIENSQALIVNLADVSEQELVTWDRYEIRSGDTLGGIAAKLGTRVDILQTVNQLRSSRIIAGDSLLIPRSSINVAAAIPNYRRRNSVSIPVPAKHTVRRGENLWTIARRYDIRSRDIARWNSIELNELLQPGQILNLNFADSATAALAEGSPATSTNEYSVRRGDTMASIARRVGVSLEQLLSLNNIAIDTIIYPGQLLKVSP